jgi:hypothetical protein
VCSSNERLESEHTFEDAGNPTKDLQSFEKAAQDCKEQEDSQSRKLAGC